MFKKTHISIFIFLLGCFGNLCPAYGQTTIEPKKEDALRLMSYNVRNCRGMDDRIDYRRVADVINRVNPDVVAVQELDSASQRNQGVFALKELADRTQMYFCYGPSIDFQGGKYGIGMLSKEKPLSYRTLPLPGREESRVLLIVEFEKFVMCCTHWSLTKEDRLLSVPLLLKAVEGIEKPLFLAGDMNSVYDAPEQVALREKFLPLNDPQVYTIPVVHPKRCIDFIYGYENGFRYPVLQRRVLTDEQTASDHLPLFVDVQIKRAE